MPCRQEELKGLARAIDKLGEWATTTGNSVTRMGFDMSRPHLRGAKAASRKIEITAQASDTRIIYVQPNGDDPESISFHAVAGIVRRHADPLSQRFAASLMAWADNKAGMRPAAP